MSTGIYKFQNLITQEVYIGQSVNLEDRYKKHKRECFNGSTPFYQAIQHWGWDNFSYEIIEFCDKEKLNEREVFWIEYYDSYHNGYNATRGGSNKNSINEEEIISLYKQGLSPKEIKTQMDISLTSVYKYLSPILKESEIQQDNLFQYSLDGMFISGWSNQEKAGKELNIDPCSIGKVLSGQRASAGGYMWSTEKVEKLISKKSPRQTKKINQYDLNDNFISSYQNAMEAARALGKSDGSAILKVCKQIRPTAYGYKWRYED